MFSVQNAMTAPSTTLTARTITRWLLSRSARVAAPAFDCEPAVFFGGDAPAVLAAWLVEDALDDTEMLAADVIVCEWPNQSSFHVPPRSLTAEAEIDPLVMLADCRRT